MKKGLTEIVFILDRSGSMGGLERDTIGGYNSMLERQKKEEGEAVLSTVLFDDKIEVLHDRKNLYDVKPITNSDYYVRGCTALLDAVGGTIHHIGNVHKNMPADQRPEKTLFIITTDGMENASKEYTYSKVKKLVEEKKKKYHWEFVFLGANIDAVEVAGRFGVAKNRAVRYECDSAGTELNFKVMSKMVSCAKKARSAIEMEEMMDCDDMLAPIQEDYRRRHK
ncbi:MAG: VWA domain-containing protein [Lachnospiraceae bacterium]|nr:VWA domain-containing protein [Lachnospiraceae bacterium]